MKILRTLTTIASLGCAAIALPAHATTYTLNETGYVYGGSLSGYFSGTDYDSNGVISGNEVQDFKLSFTGSSASPDFVINYSDFLGSLGIRGGLFYTIGDATLGSLADTSFMGLAAFDPQGTPFAEIVAYEAVLGYPGMVAYHGVGMIDVSTSPITVSSQVPEPTSLALVGLGAAALLGRRRKQA